MKLTNLLPLLVPFLLQISSSCMAELVAFPVTTHVERSGYNATRMMYSVQLVDIPPYILDAYAGQDSKKMFNLIYVAINRSTGGPLKAQSYTMDSTSIAKTSSTGTTVREALSEQNYKIGETGAIQTQYVDAGQVDICLSTAIIPSYGGKGTGNTIQEAYTSLLASGNVWSPSTVCAKTPPPDMACSLTSPGTIDLGTNVVKAGGQGVAGRTQLTLSCNMPAAVKIQSTNGATVRFASGGTGVQQIDGVGPGQKVYTADKSPQTLNYEITLNGDHKAGLIEGHSVLYLEYQ